MKNWKYEHPFFFPFRYFFVVLLCWFFCTVCATLYSTNMCLNENRQMHLFDCTKCAFLTCENVRECQTGEGKQEVNATSSLSRPLSLSLSSMLSHPGTNYQWHSKRHSGKRAACSVFRAYFSQQSKHLQICHEILWEERTNACLCFLFFVVFLWSVNLMTISILSISFLTKKAIRMKKQTNKKKFDLKIWSL